VKICEIGGLKKKTKAIIDFLKGQNDEKKARFYDY
jgi:hypothetical protein